MFQRYSRFVVCIIIIVSVCNPNVQIITLFVSPKLFMLYLRSLKGEIYSSFYSEFKRFVIHSQLSK